jgi:FAD dependent oxidoreductase TIGR03364
MNSPARVVVVGGGVLGMMHAVAARRRGFHVVHLEREPDSRGASVRNFGLVWISGRAAGPELDLARSARRRWAEIAGDVPGVGFRASGSLTLAADDAEMALIKEASALPDARQRGYEVLDATAAREINPALGGDFAGALLCTEDAIVEPRQLPAALRAHLLAMAGYRWLPGREAVQAAPHAVRDQTGEWHRGDLVVVCPGAAHTGLAGPHLAAYQEPPLRRVRLQMMQTRPYSGRVTTAIADGDSMRYYPAFALPGRALLSPQPPVAARTKAQLLLVQRVDGSLTIGDTHDYGEPFPVDVDEDPYDHLRARAQKLLGAALPPVQRRWAGVYSQVTGDELYHRSQIAPGVVLVTGTGGRGMTCSPAIAEETFA